MTNHLLIRHTLILITTFALSVTACQKAKDGEVGPQGATGATGATGPQGPKGDPGSANVIYSAWISTPFTGSGSSYTGNVTAPKITQDVLDKADIRVYWNEGGRVLSLPYAEVVGTTTYTVH
ncbi:hypothetical protein [Fibrella forsythiae]|uniref:hypothetical protein n=1 Tax=Fibrella forsythiae TaxID=2817061 RepID=UPI001E319D93|nr:hypothetical protein [Fibrella forsythiae]